MSYPPQLYHGDEGELSLSHVAADRPPDLSYASGNTMWYLATGASTGGQFGLYRYDLSPTAGGPGPHLHRTISESFFIISGTVRIYNGTGWSDADPGDFVHVPAGGIHGFRNESGVPASMLILFAPGAPREGYFEGLPHLAEMSEEEKADFFLRHDNIWL